MNYSIECQVRFSDTDAYGHVNNAVFFSYMETARFYFMKENLEHLIKSNIIFVVAKAECEYINPIDLSDKKVFVDTKIGEIKNSSFKLIYKIHNGDNKIFAIGSTVLVSINLKTSKKTTVPKEIKSTIEQ